MPAKAVKIQTETLPNIKLDLPLPPSVNRTRKLNKAALPKIAAWIKEADGLIMAAWAGGRRPKIVLDRFEVTIIVSETARVDLDNIIKCAVDYAKRLGLIRDDSREHMRRVTVKWGAAKYGCRLILRPTL